MIRQYRAVFTVIGLICLLGMTAAIIESCNNTVPEAVRDTRQSVTYSLPVSRISGPLNTAWCNGCTLYLDPSNTSTCASDSNNCQSQSCTSAGIGPCVSFREITNRWGGINPYFTANTFVYFMSSQVDSTDPVYIKPIMGQSLPFDGSYSGTVLMIAGIPSVVSTGTLSAVVSKNRASNQKLQGTVASPGVNNLVLDSTRGSYALIFTQASPATFSQPISNITLTNGPLSNFTNMIEDNGWANGDSYTQYAFPLVVVSHLEPDTTNCLTAENCGIAVNNIRVWEQNNNPGDDSIYVGPFTWMANMYTERIVKWTNAAWGSDQVVSGMVNVGMQGGFGGGMGITAYRAGNLPHGLTMLGGYVRSVTQSCVFSGVFLDFDFIIGSPISGGPHCNFASYNYIGALDIDSAALNFGIFDMKSFINNGSTNVIWGSGGTGFDNIGQIIYPANAGAAAAAFLLTSNPKISNQSVACLGIPSVASPTLTCNKTISAANLDTDLGSTSGCYFVQGSGSICNFGP